MRHERHESARQRRAECLRAGGLVGGSRCAGGRMGDRRRCGTRTPRFSANRAIREYTEKYHLPAAQRYLHSTENRAALAIELVDVQRRIDDHWQGIYFGKLENKDSDNGYHFRLQVYL